VICNVRRAPLMCAEITSGASCAAYVVSPFRDFVKEGAQP
jgi:hypothetical protein